MRAATLTHRAIPLGRREAAWQPARAVSEPVPPPPASLEALAREHQPQLLATALRLCKSRPDATDLVQDTFVRALGAFSRLRPGTNLPAYLATVLHHLFIDRVRRQGVEIPSEPDALKNLAIPQDEPEPSRWLQVGDEELGRAIDRLPEEFQAAFVLHARGLSYQEIATRLEIPRPTVGTRLVRARRRLRELLEEPR